MKNIACAALVRRGVGLACLSMVVGWGVVGSDAAKAWGVRGHAVVAALAEQHLTPRAAQAARQLLALEGRQHLYDVSSWADSVKDAKDKSVPSHAVRLSLTGDPDLRDACGHHRPCAIQGLNHYEKLLADRSRSPAERLVALKYVVHLVGDIQQPLHCVGHTGSKVETSFKGRQDSLHKVWDTIIINQQGSTGEIVRALSPRYNAADGQGAPVDWVMQCRALAATVVYAQLPAKVGGVVPLPAGYARANWPVAERQLLRGGARLATLLNRALDAPGR